MKKIILLIIFFSFSFSFQNVEATKKNILQLHKQNITIIDIRTPPEWQATGTIPFAKKITFFTKKGINRSFIELLRLNKLDKKSNFAIICRTGHRSKVASEILEKNGFKHIINLKGGMFRLFKDMLKNDFKGGK
ncbi:MAG: rhodanese-like domain-containing protein [Nautilia sp.]|nr:MAG: rhodanese-like domain-containing protein [Nautilia sp.]